MKRRAGGFTLVEVLVTLGVFGLILTLTLWSYVQGVKASHRNDEGSEVFRRANTVFSRIETLVESSQILYVDAQNIVFHPLQESPLTATRQYAWSDRARTLYSGPDGLQEVEGSETKTLFSLKKWEKLSFQAQQVGESSPDPRPDTLTLHFTSTPPSVTRESRERAFQRTVILARY